MKKLLKPPFKRGSVTSDPNACQSGGSSQTPKQEEAVVKTSNEYGSEDLGSDRRASDAKIFGATWRRRKVEALGERVGLFKNEADENTPVYEEEQKKFEDAAEKLYELEKCWEQLLRVEVGQVQAVEDLAKILTVSDVDTRQAVFGGKDDRTIRLDVLSGMLEAYIVPLKNQANEVAAVIKEYKEWCKDYFSRKRKLENERNKKTESEAAMRERQAKFDHSKQNVCQMKNYLKPLLDAFCETVRECQVHSLRTLGAVDRFWSRARSDRLESWAKKLRQAPGSSSDPVVRLLWALDETQQQEQPRAPAWPRTPTRDKLAILLAEKPLLTDSGSFTTAAAAAAAANSNTLGSPQPSNRPPLPHRRLTSGGAVYGATIEHRSTPPVLALEALLKTLLARGGLQREGIFRIPGNSDDVADLKLQLDAPPGLDPYGVLERNAHLADIEDLATLTKMWFRDRPEPVLTPTLDNAFRVAAHNNPDDDQAFGSVIQLALQSDASQSAKYDAHAYCLAILLSFLHTVAAKASTNMMTASNLAVCFAPNIFLNETNGDPTAMHDVSAAISLFTRLINVAPYLEFIISPENMPLQNEPTEDGTPSSSTPPARYVPTGGVAIFTPHPSSAETSPQPPPKPHRAPSAAGLPNVSQRPPEVPPRPKPPPIPRHPS